MLETRQAPAEGGERIAELVALIDALIEVVREENAALAIGLPASQSRHTELKTRLAVRFEAWVADVKARRLRLHSPDQALQDRFLSRIDCLRLLTEENVIRLRAAIEASQRRIDAVMAAIREQISDVSPYAANGRVKGRAASYSAGVRA